MTNLETIEQQINQLQSYNATTRKKLENYLKEIGVNCVITKINGWFNHHTQKKINYRVYLLLDPDLNTNLDEEHASTLTEVTEAIIKLLTVIKSRITEGIIKQQ